MKSNAILILDISCFIYSFVFLLENLKGPLFGASVLKFYSDMPVLEVCFHTPFQMLSRPFDMKTHFFFNYGKIS